MRKSATKCLRPSDIFKILNVKDQEEAERVFKFTLSFLSYLSPDDILKTPDVTYTKISKDMIHIDSKVNLDDVIDTFNKRKIIEVKF
jgi:hypothetical protein